MEQPSSINLREAESKLNNYCFQIPKQTTYILQSVKSISSYIVYVMLGISTYLLVVLSSPFFIKLFSNYPLIKSQTSSPIFSWKLHTFNSFPSAAFGIKHCFGGTVKLTIFRTIVSVAIANINLVRQSAKALSSTTKYASKNKYPA